MRIVDDKPSLDELQHYGVKGMHWGVRKQPQLATGYSKGSYNYDKRELGSRSAKRINESVSKGLSLKDARLSEQKRKAKNRKRITLGAMTAFAFGPAIMGAASVASQIARIGAQAGANAYVHTKRAQAGQKAANDLFSDSRGISSYKLVDLGFDPATNSWS
jgi:hypothetical protein